MFHVHVYYPLRMRTEAIDLHHRIEQRSDVQQVYALTDRLVGPHKMPMFECHFPECSDELIEWLDQARGEFSVLIHPVTGSDLQDHTVSAIWLGRELGVFEETLS